MLPEDRSRSAWWGLGFVLAGIVAFVVWRFIGTFVFGVFIYYATRPVYSRLKRRIKPRSLAAAVSLVVIATPAVLLLAYTVAVGIREFGRIAKQYDVGPLEGYVAPYLDLSALTLTPEEILRNGGLDAVRGVLTSATAYAGFLGIGALHLFVMIAIAFYLLRDDHRLSRWVCRRFADDAGVLEAYLDAVDRNFHQIFFGNILNAVMTGVIGAIAYSLLDVVAPAGLGIPYPALLGLLTGVASLIPVVGMKLVYVPASVYLVGKAVWLDESGLLWFPLTFALISFVIVDTIPDLVLRPYVSGRHLHVGMVMIAYIFGPLLFGWYGIFLAPMLLVLVVQFGKLVLPELVAGSPIRPIAVDPSNITEAPGAPVKELDGKNDGNDGDGNTPNGDDGSDGDENGSDGNDGDGNDGNPPEDPAGG